MFSRARARKHAHGRARTCKNAHVYNSETGRPFWLKFCQVIAGGQIYHLACTFARARAILRACTCNTRTLISPQRVSHFGRFLAPVTPTGNGVAGGGFSAPQTFFIYSTGHLLVYIYKMRMCVCLFVCWSVCSIFAGKRKKLLG